MLRWRARESRKEKEMLNVAQASKLTIPASPKGPALKEESFTVHLTYFKKSGKYYSEGEYVSQKHDMFDIVAEVRQLLASGTHPGLRDGPDDWFVVIDVPNHPHDCPTLHIPSNS